MTPVRHMNIHNICLLMRQTGRRCLFSEKRQAYVRTEVGRLFGKKEFYFSVSGIVLILFLSANDGMGHMGIRFWRLYCCRLMMPDFC